MAKTPRRKSSLPARSKRSPRSVGTSTGGPGSIWWLWLGGAAGVVVAVAFLLAALRRGKPDLARDHAGGSAIAVTEESSAAVPLETLHVPESESGGGADRPVSDVPVQAAEIRLLHTLEPPSDQPGAYADVQLTPDGRLAIAAYAHHRGLAGTWAIWELQQQHLLHSIRDRDVYVQRVAVSPDGRLAAIGYQDGVVQVWNLAERRRLQEVNAHSKPVLGLCFSADGERIVTGSPDATVSEWDVQTGRRLRHMATTQCEALALSPDGRTVAVGGGQFGLWNLETGELVHRLLSGCFCLAFSPDGKRIAAGSVKDNSILVWDVESGEERFSVVGHSARPGSVQFLSDDLLLSGAADRRLRIWSLSTGQMIAEGKADRVATQHLGVAIEDGKAISAGSYFPNDAGEFVVDLRSPLHVWRLPQLPDSLSVQPSLAATSERPGTMAAGRDVPSGVNNIQTPSEAAARTTLSPMRTTPHEREAIAASPPAAITNIGWHPVRSATAQTVVESTTGTKNHAVQLFGDGSGIVIDSRLEPMDQLTVECWVELADDLPQSARMVDQMDPGSHSFWISRVGPNWVFMRTAEGGGPYVLGGQPTTDRKWQHIAGVWDSGRPSLFVNGELQESKVARHRLAPRSDPDPKSVIRLGSDLRGVLDEVRISRVARYREDFVPQRRFESDDDTLALYHFDEGEGTTVRDSSGHERHGRLHHARWLVETGHAPDPHLYDLPVTSKLAQPTVANLIGTRLPDALKFFADRHKVPITLSDNAIHAAKQSVNIATRTNVPLGVALWAILRPLDLDLTVDGSSLVVTTREEAQSHRFEQTHFVPAEHLTELGADTEELLHVLPTLIQGLASGSPRQSPLPDLQGDKLRVVANQQTHRELTEILDELRRAALDGTGGSSGVVEVALATRIPVQSGRRPWVQWVDYVTGAVKLSYFIDEYALQALGVALDAPGSLGGTMEVEAALALTQLLAPLELTWTIREGTLVITTQAESESMLVTRIYRAPSGANPQQTMVRIMRDRKSGPWAGRNGSGGVAAVFGDWLIVRQHLNGHHRIRELIASDDVR